MSVSATITHNLHMPVTFEGREHTSITLRRIKGKDIREIGKQDEGDKALWTIARLSGWPHAGVDELDAADIDAISTIIESFTEAPTPQ